MKRQGIDLARRGKIGPFSYDSHHEHKIKMLNMIVLYVLARFYMMQGMDHACFNSNIQFMLLKYGDKLLPWFLSHVGKDLEEDQGPQDRNIVKPTVIVQVETKDGFLLSVQHIPHGKNSLKVQSGPPVFLQHGLFQGGDTWFVNSVEESLGFILADHGFDVWVGNVRGTRWSHGHVTLSEHERAFWDWSWQELAQNDLVDMISFVYSKTNSKVFFVGHSQGTIMALAAFTMPDTVKMIEAAALLCPISYLDHISSRFVLRAVSMHLDQMLLTLGIHQLNFRSDIGVQLLDSLCDGHMDCGNLLSSITGENCCFNKSRVDYYLEYEPHPSSTKNLNHLFQMIRKGTFAKYDYGLWGNLKRYGRLHPPAFDLQDIPESLPLWMAYGGSDALADVTDVKRTIEGLRSEPELLYIDPYGHIDFIMSVRAKDDVYGKLISFFRSCGGASSY